MGEVNSECKPSEFKKNSDCKFPVFAFPFSVYWVTVRAFFL